jgi:hypothetical protein
MRSGWEDSHNAGSLLDEKGAAVLTLSMELCGWIGGLLLICAYALVSFGRISPRGGVFQSLNLAGSLMLAGNSAFHHAWPSVSVNLIWIAVGAGALMKCWLPNANENLKHCVNDSYSSREDL